MSNSFPETVDVDESENQWTPELDKLLRRWKKQIEIRRRGHYKMSRKFSKRHYIIGIPATIMNTVIASGTLSTFQNCENPSDCNITQGIRIAIGVVGIFSTCLTATQTFLNYQDSAQNHKSASDNYESLYGNIDSLLIVPTSARGNAIATLQSIRKQYDDIVKKSPNLPADFQVSLDYAVSTIAEKNKKGKKSIPTINPKDVDSPQDFQNNNSNESKILQKVIEDNEVEDSENIEIKFDLDGITTDPSSLSMQDFSHKIPSRDNKNEDKRKSMTERVQSSLYKALDFEQKRLDHQNINKDEKEKEEKNEEKDIEKGEDDEQEE